MEGQPLLPHHFNDKEKIMIKKVIIKSEDGFTLVELMITMVVFVFVMTAASVVFTGLLTQFKQQSKIAETNIEGIVGLEILRQDIEHAGYGLPWNFQSAINYSEAASSPGSSYNDAPGNIPRPVVTGNNVSYSGTHIYNGSDYLVIKASNATQDPASLKFTTLSSISPYKVTWDPSTENFTNTDNVVVLSPGTTDANAKTLIVNGATFYTPFQNVASSPWLPLDRTTTNVVYGISTGTPVRPFNRADYYISRPTSNMPSRCAPGTGILYKAVMNQDNSGSFNLLPLLDCVADMQVVYAIDRVGNGTIEYIDDLAGLTDTNGNGLIDPLEIRQQVTEVRVYVLAHEGQRDTSFTYQSSSIRIPPLTDPAAGVGRPAPGFDLTQIGDPEYKYYRWKIYTVVARPIDLR